MRWFPFFFLALLLSCREILPVEQEENITGYQINGSVTNQSGNLIPNVIVLLYYDEQKISYTQTDTTVVFVTDTNQVVTIQVFSIKNILVRTLFLNKMTIGHVPRFSWDGLNDKGVEVPSGLYLIQYKIDTAVVKESPVVIDGIISARTDTDGHFVIPNEYLPVNKTYDKYLQDTFQGVYLIGSSVVLELVFGTYVKTGRVYLKKDKVTKVNITM
jgi:hypothetical protein